MAERYPIGDLDLLAYADDADGLDPQHREAIEAHLREHPDDAARVEIFRRQNNALRQRYEPYRRAPVPERLYDALEVEEDRPRPRLLRHAAAAAIVAAAAVAGWIAGGGHGGPALVALRDDEPQSVRHAAPEAGAVSPFAMTETASPGDAAGLPDLTHLGFSLIETQPVPGSSQAVRLSYAGDDGRRFNLLLRTRWHDQEPGFQVHTEGDVAIVSWEEGEIAAELSSRIGRDEALEIAEAVRASLRSYEPIQPLPNQGAVAVGSADPVVPLDPESTLLPQQIQ